MAIEPLTNAVLLKAMDGLALRALVTSHNIANAGSPGYRPLAVDFEAALASAAARRDVAAVGAVQPHIAQAVDAQGRSDLRLDLELANSAETASRYTALAELLNRRLQLQSLATSGSR